MHNMETTFQSNLIYTFITQSALNGVSKALEFLDLPNVIVQKSFTQNSWSGTKLHKIRDDILMELLRQRHWGLSVLPQPTGRWAGDPSAQTVSKDYGGKGMGGRKFAKKVEQQDEENMCRGSVYSM